MTDPDQIHTHEKPMPRRFFLVLAVASLWFFLYILVHETITAHFQSLWTPETQRFSVSAKAAETIPQTTHEALEKSFNNGVAVLGKCIICHDVSNSDLDVSRFGPPLNDLFINGVASKDYDYSPALRSIGQMGKPWTAQQLAAFIHAPETYAEKTRMPFPGLSDFGEIRDLVHYFAWSACASDCGSPVVLRLDEEALAAISPDKSYVGDCTALAEYKVSSEALVSDFEGIVLIPSDFSPCGD